jgi:hypothetical protein
MQRPHAGIVHLLADIGFDGLAGYGLGLCGYCHRFPLPCRAGHRYFPIRRRLLARRNLNTGETGG